MADENVRDLVEEEVGRDLDAEEVERLKGALVIDMVGCSRCGGEGHEQRPFLRFINAIPTADGETVQFSHWSICPGTGEPILLAVEKLGEEAGQADPASRIILPD